MKSILVTGGAGFIGSHTSLLLLEKGYVIFIIDSFINSSDKSLERITVVICDHQARDLLSCVDRAIVLSNGKIIASGTPNEIIKKAYNSFGHDHIVYKEVNKRFYEIGSFKGINELKKFFKKRYEKF